MQPNAEDVAFDKADDAAEVQRIRTAIAHIDAQLELPPDEGDKTDPEKRARLEDERARLAEKLKTAEEKMQAKELAEAQGIPGSE